MESEDYYDDYVFVEKHDCINVYEELEELKKKRSDMQAKGESGSTEFQDLQCKYQELETKYCDLLSKNSTLMREREELAQRLSKEWSDKVAGNESDVENISIKNRPMVVAEEYQRLFTDEWLEVKTMLDARTDLIEEQKIAFLCDIFMETMTIAKNKYDNRLGELIKNLTFPLSHSAAGKKNSGILPSDRKRASSSIRVSTEEADEEILLKHAKSEEGDFVVIPDSSGASNANKLPGISTVGTHIMNEIGDYYRKTADAVDLKGILLEAHKFITQRKEKGDNWLITVEADKTLQDFVKHAARVAWKMAIQRPSMTCSLEGTGDKWNETTQEVAYCSDDPSHDLSRVKLYQYPALYHDTKLMVKGKVVVKRQTDASM